MREREREKKAVHRCCSCDWYFCCWGVFFVLQKQKQKCAVHTPALEKPTKIPMKYRQQNKTKIILKDNARIFVPILIKWKT